MNTFKSLKELTLDPSTLLRLAVDTSDPPRFYVLDHRQRQELIAIGDAELATERFLRRVAQQQLSQDLRDGNRRSLPAVSPWLAGMPQEERGEDLTAMNVF